MAWSVLALAIGLVAALLWQAAPQRSAREAEVGRAAAVAETLITAHQAAVVHLLANPGAVGSLPLTAATGRSVSGVSACADASSVAAWMPAPGVPAGAVAVALQERWLGWWGAGVADAGVVDAGRSRVVPLPCTVPDGAPVVVTGRP